MCLILFAIRSHPNYPLVLAANREERHSRPTAPMAPWPDDEDILAGRDLEAGGTWLGLHRNGRFAAITNRREGVPTTAGLRSRGALTREFLTGVPTGEEVQNATGSAEKYAQRVFDERAHYAGFNLLIGDRTGMWYCATEVAPRLLPPGVYGLSNGQLDTPWPKVTNGKLALQGELAGMPSTAGLLAILEDRVPAADHELPDTGIGLEHERVLSSCFILGDEYGTRASTALLIDAAGTATVAEQNFGAGGSVRELQQWRWPLAAIPC